MTLVQSADIEKQEKVMRIFEEEDFTETPCQPEWDAYHNAKTDAERSSVVLRNYRWVCEYSIEDIDPIELIKECLDAGADVNSKDSDGWTALMWTANLEHSDCMRLLIEAGAT